MRSAILTPTSVPIDEYQTLTTTFFVTEDNPELDPIPYYLKVFPLTGSVNKYSKYSVIVSSDTSITVTMTLSDVFDRNISFVKDLQKYAVTRFGDLPDTYDGVYKYIPPEVMTKTHTFVIPVYYGPTSVSSTTVANSNINIEYVVTRNLTTDRVAFQKAIVDGGFAKVATLAGYYP